MPLDWLNTPLDADIGDLIARKKRAKTIELLRSQLQGRMAPPVQMRLQLADLLVQAGREAEAVPVLIGLADEFAGDGFVAKAIAILKRVDKVQPGREDVESRLGKLVRQQRDAPPARPRSRGRGGPEFGIEEIGETLDAADEIPAAVDAATAPDAPPEAALEPAPAVELPPIVEVPEAAPVRPDTDTSRRVRGVFRRFLASLPGTASHAAAAAAERAAVEPAAKSPSGATQPPEPPPLPVTETASAAPESPVAEPPAAEPPAAEPPADTAPDEATATADRTSAEADEEADWEQVRRADLAATAAAYPTARDDEAEESEPEEGDEESETEAEAADVEPEAEEEATDEEPPEEDSDTTEVDADAIELDEPEEAAASAFEPDEDTRPDIVIPGAAPLPPSSAEDPASPEAAATGHQAGDSDAHVADAAASGVAGKLKGALRWLVSNLGPTEEGGTAPQEATAPEAAKETPSATPPELETAPPAASATEAPEDEDEEPMSDEVFQERLLDLAQDLVRLPTADPAASAAPLDRGLVLRYAQRLLATSLFGDLTEEELLAVVRGLRLHLHGPGDVLLTEGERGQSVFVIASGSAKVYVRSPSGRNFPVAELREGEFFGEISSLSGRPRSATITSSAPCELLELDRPTLDEIARSHPRVADVLEEFYIRRASSPEAAAVRAVATNDAGAERKAIEVLEAHFGQSRWDPRMRLRLADVLLKAGKYEDAIPVLIGLADDLARAGYAEKAIAVLKKIEKIRRRDIETVNLAPRRGAPASDKAAGGTRRKRGAKGPVPTEAPTEPVAAAPAPVKGGWRPQPTAEFFQGWLLDVLRDRVEHPDPAASGAARPEDERSGLGSIRGYGPGLMASPLFEDFDDDELLAVIRGLRLLSFDTGDIIITEGEPGQSLFVLTTGTVKVFVRDRAGRNVALVPLGEGAFFGEIATLSGRPRSATVTAASRCELLELDKTALEAILKVHPRVRDVLEEHYIARANDPEAAVIRGTRQDEPPRGGPA